jgi:haloalkane dehalogenase
MRVLRTPDECFENLADYPFAPHYVEVALADVEPLRMHYVDEGPRDAAPIVLMHGEPSWSYLYRTMITGLVARGHRVLAPDLVGFGRSDKPAEPGDYTYERHVAWMRAWLEQLDLRGVTLFCQDWGGLIGLRLVAAMPERFARVVAANTGLPVGSGLTPAFERWLQFSQSVPELPIADIVAMATVRKLSASERAAYLAPFPDESYKAGARRFPALVPITPEHASVAENRAAWAELARFDKPFLTAFSDQDPITRGGDAIMQAKIPGTRGQPHVTIENAGHFLQEDAPTQLVDLIDTFVRTPAP